MQKVKYDLNGIFSKDNLTPTCVFVYIASGGAEPAAAGETGGNFHLKISLTKPR